jgi:hypothetical protein
MSEAYQDQEMGLFEDPVEAMPVTKLSQQQRIPGDWRPAQSGFPVTQEFQ